MTTLAQKLDARFQNLDAETLRLLEVAFFGVIAAIEKRGDNSLGSARLAKPYRLKSYPLGLQPGVDANKLGQLDDVICLAECSAA